MATTSTKQTCNCTAKAYPKYSKTPSQVVPMPPLNTQPCKGCGAKQVCVATFNMTSVQLLKTQAATIDQCVSVSACVYQWTVDLLPPDTSQVSQQQGAAERRWQLLYHCERDCPQIQNMSIHVVLSVWLEIMNQSLFNLFFLSPARWMRWPCPSLSLGISWSQWMPALEISQRKDFLPKWMQRWNST